MNDEIVDAGQAFVGQGIQSGNIGMVQLWNPSNSGVILYVDKCVVALDLPNVAQGADFRKISSPFSTLFPAGHYINKDLNQSAPKAEVRVQSGSLPSAPPFHEIWTGSAYNDREYTFDPPLKVRQGNGIYVAAANPGVVIASFQWREKEDNTPWTPVESIVTNMDNPSCLVDGNDSTYSRLEGVEFYVGKTWAALTSMSNITIKSTPTFSFSGANPPRVLAWHVEVFDGSIWSEIANGTYTETGTGATQNTISASFTPTSAYGHRIRVVDTALAGHRVGTMIVS